MNGDVHKPSPLGPHYLIEAYNRSEITFAQWREKAVAWASATPGK